MPKEQEKISARIDGVLYDRLNQAAAIDCRSRSSAIEIAIAEWVLKIETQRPKGVTP